MKVKTILVSQPEPKTETIFKTGHCNFIKKTTFFYSRFF